MTRRGSTGVFTGGRSSSVIDYMVGEREVKKRIQAMRIGDKIDSDQYPIEISLTGENRLGGRKGRRGDRSGVRGISEEEEREEFKRKMERIERKEREVNTE